MSDSNAPSSSSLVSLNFPLLKCTFLDKDTDLNEQPIFNNSLALLLSYWLQQAGHHDDIFASFRSANAHLDQLGEFDVISDAKNIKKLLKTPFNKHSQISMIVHRFGRTILLDEFDVHSHLLRLEKDGWSWFREFFLDTVLRNISVKHLYKKNKTRTELIRKDRLVNFLCQSVEYSPLICTDEIRRDGPSGTFSGNVDDEGDGRNRSYQTTSSPFQRTALWTFENMKMLIGSDLPIFGDEKHPAVSLRLREMNKPINVLTGIDCWLDNLMCNVPELAMCYHVDGIVQSYDMVKTEDIPYREGCNFPPTVIRDLATNLLSFLKANATKEGHTYWLFKGPDDDIVKLYDLTSLCGDSADENPYTLPVATLFYRMAQNIIAKSDHETRSKESGTIRTLLKHCLDMLNPEKFPEYHCAAAYMMSDLYIDDNVSEQSWTSDDENDVESLDDDDRASIDDDDEEEDSSGYRSVTIERLIHRDSSTMPETEENVERLRPVHGNLERRAKEALKYLVQALRSNAIHRRVQATAATNGTDDTSTAKIVPLPYQATRHSSKVLIDQKNHLTSDRRLKSLILHKASAAYFCLVDRNENEKNYGSCLRYLRLALHCFSAELKFQSIDQTGCSSESKKLLSYIMSIAGDCRLMMAHITSNDEWDRFREQYRNLDQVDREIEQVIEEIGINDQTSEFAWVSELTTSIDRNLFASVHAYEYAMNIVKNLGDDEKKRLYLLTKKFANVRNEMGVYSMNRCAQAVKTLDHEAAKEVKDLFRKSFESFDAAIQAFEKINDLSNIASVHCNLGRLMRYYAQFYAPVVNGIRQEFSPQERQSYQKAFDYYLQGLKMLENRSDLFEVFRTLSWELSNTYFAMAVSLQDYPPKSSMTLHEIEKELIDCLTRALKYLEVELNTSASDRYALAKFRAGTIHHRLASLLYQNYRLNDNPNRRKQLRTLASSHCQKALKFLSIHEHPLEYLRVLMEEIHLAEFDLSHGSDPSAKLKSSHQGLRSVFQCEECLKIIDQRRLYGDPDDYNESFAQELQRLLNGVQTLLKERLKIFKTHPTKKSLYDDEKEMFSIVLRVDPHSSSLSADLLNVLEKMKKIFEKNNSD